VKPSLVYKRAITSGLGDRFGNYLCAAALARALGTVCHIYWANNFELSGRTYCVDLVRKYVRLPENIFIYDDAEHARDSCMAFGADEPTQEFVEIVYTGNELPATNAYDCVYTLAHRALSVPGYSVDDSGMESAFRSVGHEWSVHADRAFPGSAPYIAVHLRGGDKSVSHSSLESEFATDRLLRLLPRDIDVVVVTDDSELLDHYRSRHPFLRYSSRPRGAEDADFVDMVTLMNASAIIQHSYAGWSAFSSVIAMAKGIPLINTYIGRGDNLLLDFRRHGGCPAELRPTENADALHRFVRDVRLSTLDRSPSV
jgi:hypothetical protein